MVLAGLEEDGTNGTIVEERELEGEESDQPRRQAPTK